MAMQEAREEFGKMLRWTEQPDNADQGEKTIYLGPTVQGFYVNKRENVGQNASNVYEIKLPNGELVAMWGSQLLDGRFDKVPLGCEVRVTCLGRQQPKTPTGRPYMGFKVEFDPTSRAPMQEVGHPADPAPARDTEVEASAAAAMAPAPAAPAAPAPQAAPAPAPVADNQGY